MEPRGGGGSAVVSEVNGGGQCSFDARAISKDDSLL